MTNERELATVLAKIFPTECWEADVNISYLTMLTREDTKRLYKRLWVLDPTKQLDDCKVLAKAKRISIVLTSECEENVDSNFDQYMSEEFNRRNETKRLSSSELAHNVITVLQKLVEVENASVLGQTDQNSVTMCCLNFSLDTLGFLHQQKVFSENDQTVIKMKLMELTILCFNNLVNRDGKAIEPVFKKLFHLLEVSENPEVTCGLVLNILTILCNLCVKTSVQKTQNLNIFTLCNHLILMQLENLSNDKELLHIVHKMLIRIIKNIKTEHQTRMCDKKKPKRQSKELQRSCHHDSSRDSCVFERLLIDSFAFIKSFRKLKLILDYFSANGICCCNGNVETIRIFMRPTTVSYQFLKVLHRKVIEPMFDRMHLCVHCNDKLTSDCFKEEYFLLIRSELERRQGWELHTLLHHLKAVQKKYSKGFLHKFVFDVIVPIFETQKVKFFNDPEENSEAKIITTNCLTILNESMREESIVVQFFSIKMIHYIRDCSLNPAMATHSCQLIKHAIDNIKLLGSDENQRDNIAKFINNILFSNVLYLIRELMEIYGQMNLPKDVPLMTVQDSSDKLAEEGDFEILDEKTVAVKEALTDMDVLLLSTIHWNILCDLITKDPAFQHDFVANIYNNFSGNILFTIAYNALNSILLKKELKTFQLSVISERGGMISEELPALFERCEFLQPVLVTSFVQNYQKVIKDASLTYEITKSFLDALKKTKQEDSSLIYRLRRDNATKFHVPVPKEVFLTDNVSDDPRRKKLIANDAEENFFFYHNWLNQIWIGIFEGKAIRDRFLKIVNKFARGEEELKAIHRANIIREITSRYGIKYLSSIARNCFDICWRLSDNISFSKSTSHSHTFPIFCTELAKPFNRFHSLTLTRFISFPTFICLSFHARSPCLG